MKLRIYSGLAKATDSCRDLNLSFNYSCGLLRLRVKSDWSQKTINMGLKMREIGFQRTYIFKIFRGSMPPNPPRKVRLRRTITFSMTYEHPLENLSYAPDDRMRMALIGWSRGESQLRAVKGEQNGILQ